MAFRRRRREGDSVMEIMLDPIFDFIGSILVLFMLQVIATINLVDQDLVVQVDQARAQVDSLAQYRDEAEATRDLLQSAQGQNRDLEARLGTIQEKLTEADQRLAVQQVELAEAERLRAGCDAGQALEECRTKVQDMTRQVVAATAATLRLRTQSLPPAVIGQAYELALAAEGGTEPYHWSVDGALPAGLQLDSDTGRIHGIANAAETVEPSIVVRDSAENPLVDSRPLKLQTLVVSGIGSAPHWSAQVPYWFWLLLVLPLLLFYGWTRVLKWRFLKECREAAAQGKVIQFDPNQFLSKRRGS